MRALPPELRLWEPYLDFLSFDLRGDLAALAGLLTRHLGHRPSRRIDAGEPNGWSGLVNRGPFERLLSSEWALSNEMHDEFLRRATDGELLYWQQSQESRSPGGTVRVLFDAGPDQLGACRVVQLALLVVLARRAAEQGCELAWRVAQSDTAGWETDLSPRAIRTFLQGRSHKPLCDGDVESLNSASSRQDERWLVGGAARRGVPSVVLESNRDIVRIVTPSSKAELTLPSTAVCQQLLRNPFRALDLDASGSIRGGRTGTRLRFAFGGRKLVSQADHCVVVHPIPNSPKDPPGNLRRYELRFPGPLLAMGDDRRFWGLQVVRTSKQERFWAIYQINLGDRRKDQVRQWPVPTTFDDSMLEHTPGCCWKSQGRFWIQIGDSLWRADDQSLTFETTAQTFLARGESTLMMVQNELSAIPPKRLLTMGDQFHEVRLSHWHHGRLEVAVAMRVAEDEWKVLCNDAFHRLPGLEGKVLGVIGHAQDHRVPVLVAQREQSIAVGTTILDFDSPLEEVVLSPYNALIGYRTAAGEIGVYSHAMAHFLLRVRP